MGHFLTVTCFAKAAELVSVELCHLVINGFTRTGPVDVGKRTRTSPTVVRPAELRRANLHLGTTKETDFVIENE